MLINVTRKHSICLLVIGIIYAVVGIGFGEIAKHVTTEQSRAWRFGAWIVCGIVYAVHFGWEQLRIQQRSTSVALNVAMAVGLGGFLLAVAAGVHALTVEAHAPLWLHAVALIAWPIFTGVPAFIVTLIISAILSRLRMTST